MSFVVVCYLKDLRVSKQPQNYVLLKNVMSYNQQVWNLVLVYEDS